MLACYATTQIHFIDSLVLADIQLNDTQAPRRHPTATTFASQPMSKRQLSLNFFIYPDGHHEAAWRHKASTTDRILDVTYYQELAQRAEAHKFDAVFFADGPALADNVRSTPSVSGSSRLRSSPRSRPPPNASV
ncbi:hypothetical protein ACVWWR_008802 [Bradyrhizobium sp. LM3.2]